MSSFSKPLNSRVLQVTEKAKVFSQDISPAPFSVKVPGESSLARLNLRTAKFFVQNELTSTFLDEQELTNDFWEEVIKKGVSKVVKTKKLADTINKQVCDAAEKDKAIIIVHSVSVSVCGLKTKEEGHVKVFLQGYTQSAVAKNNSTRFPSAAVSTQLVPATLQLSNSSPTAAVVVTINSSSLLLPQTLSSSVNHTPAQQMQPTQKVTQAKSQSRQTSSHQKRQAPSESQGQNKKARCEATTTTVPVDQSQHPSPPAPDAVAKILYTSCPGCKKERGHSFNCVVDLWLTKGNMCLPAGVKASKMYHDGKQESEPQSFRRVFAENQSWIEESLKRLGLL
jgi:hypothetical protein